MTWQVYRLALAKIKYPFNNFARFSFTDIVSEDTQIKNLINILKKVAKTTSPVLIYGETGNGKELFAQSLHNSSPRKLCPFIAQNCAALPESIRKVS